MSKPDFKCEPVLTDKQVKRRDYLSLRCPHGCDPSFLHQEGTIVYEPYEKDEDARHELIVSVHPGVGGGLSVLRQPPTVIADVHEARDWHNPSDRRQGLAILFRCEICGNHAELCILQDRGITFLTWREPTVDLLGLDITGESSLGDTDYEPRPWPPTEE
jgi:hypothetical protein